MSILNVNDFGLIAVIFDDFHVAVLLQARAGGNQLADDDVFLQSDERIGLAADRRFGQNAGRLLEGGRG